MCAAAPAVVGELRRLCSRDNIRGLGMSHGMRLLAAQALFTAQRLAG